MPRERIVVQLRLRLMAKRSIDELVAYTGSSREEVIHALILDGLPVMYARLGIERDPAAMTAGLLDAMIGQWDDTLTDDEIAGFEVTRKALDRIVQVRSRET